MFGKKPYTPEQPKEAFYTPLNWADMKAEFDRLYLEKCQEVNELERKVEKHKNMAEIAVKQKHDIEVELNCKKSLISALSLEMEEMKQEALTADLISRERALEALEMTRGLIIPMSVLLSHEAAGEVLAIFNARIDKAKELINEIPAVSSASIIRELAAEPLKGFIPDVEPPEELPEELMEELPLWRLQPTTSQDILCLSSALKNLHDIHKCDSFVLYNKLSRGLEKKIDHYFGED